MMSASIRSRRSASCWARWERLVAFASGREPEFVRANVMLPRAIFVRRPRHAPRARGGAAGQFILSLTKRPDHHHAPTWRWIVGPRRAAGDCGEERPMPIFQSERGRLHYEELGAGRPVLLIHGFTNYGLAWAPQLAALVHAGYRVILPDLHGHGASAPATSLCTVADLAADMVRLLDPPPVGCAP